MDGGLRSFGKLLAYQSNDKPTHVICMQQLRELAALEGGVGIEFSEVPEIASTPYFAVITAKLSYQFRFDALQALRALATTVSTFNPIKESRVNIIWISICFPLAEQSREFWIIDLAIETPVTILHT